MYPTDIGAHEIEPELRGPTPRRVRYTFRAQASRVFVWCLLLGGVWLVTTLSRNDLRVLTRLEARGVTTTGRVTGEHTSSGKSTTYYLDYAFTADGATVSDEESVSSSVYQRTSADAPVVVTYLPDDPQTHRVGVVDGARVTQARTAWGLGTLGVALVFGALLLATEVRVRRHRALLESGVAMTGRLTGHIEVPGNRSSSYYVLYEFDGPGGTVMGKETVNRTQFQQTCPGTAATVLYDPAAPNNSQPYYLMTDVRLA